MATFKVNLNGLQQQASSFTNMNGKLKNLAQDVLNVQNSIGEDFPAKRYLVRALNNVETNILKEAVKMNRLSQALGYISEQYIKSDRYIADQMSLMEEITYKLENGFIDFMRLLGLDELFMKLKYDFENFDRERTQEYLMDKYLQNECFELLEEDRYSEEAWANATYEEREQMIRDFIREVNERLDTRTDITVIFDDGKGNTDNNGYFSYQGNDKAIIYINPKRLRNGDYAVFNTCIHESRHCYQHAAVEHPERYVVSEETLKQWEKNFKPENYKEDGDAYYAQPIEWDAFNFAHQEYRVDGITPDYDGSWGDDH